MTRLETLQALQSRIAEAKGPNKALAREIMCSVGGWHRVAPRFTRSKYPHFIGPQDWIGERSDGSPILDSLHGTDMHRDVPDVTSSLDAVVALIKRELPPPWRYVLADPGYIAGVWQDGKPVANFYGPWSSGSPDVALAGPAPALALLQAFISALIAKEPTHAD